MPWTFLLGQLGMRTLVWSWWHPWLCRLWEEWGINDMVYELVEATLAIYRSSRRWGGLVTIHWGQTKWKVEGAAGENGNFQTSKGFLIFNFRLQFLWLVLDCFWFNVENSIQEKKLSSMWYYTWAAHAELNGLENSRVCCPSLAMSQNDPKYNVQLPILAIPRCYIFHVMTVYIKG